METLHNLHFVLDTERVHAVSSLILCLLCLVCPAELRLHANDAYVRSGFMPVFMHTDPRRRAPKWINYYAHNAASASAASHRTVSLLFAALSIF